MKKQKNRKSLILFVIAGSAMILIVVYTFYPGIVTFINKINFSHGVSNDLHNSGTSETKPAPLVTNSESEVIYPTFDLYSDQYWNNVEESKKEDYASIMEYLNNIEAVILQSKNNSNFQCNIQVYNKPQK